jgi:hypothetical protein
MQCSPEFQELTSAGNAFLAIAERVTDLDLNERNWQGSERATIKNRIMSTET